MKTTAVLENLPKNFWKIIRKNKYQDYFLKRKSKDFFKAEVAIIRTKTIFDKDMFNKFPNLKFIIRAGTGYDNIDLIEAEKRNVFVSNTPLANINAAFEHTMALIFASLKKIKKADKWVQNKYWKRNLQLNFELLGLKVLVVGVGRIGTKVANALVALGADVKGVDPFLSKEDWEKKGIKDTNFLDGICTSNLVTFHCPLTRNTLYYFNDDIVKKIEKPIFLVNTSRGKVVSESALRKGILENKLIGVGLDVFEEEPYSNSLNSDFDNIICTPHTGAFTFKAKERISQEIYYVWHGFVSQGVIANDVIKESKKYDFFYKFT